MTELSKKTPSSIFLFHVIALLVKKSEEITGIRCEPSSFYVRQRTSICGSVRWYARRTVTLKMKTPGAPSWLVGPANEPLYEAMSVHPSVYPSAHPSACRNACPSVHPFVHLSVTLGLKISDINRIHQNHVSVLNASVEIISINA